MTVQYFAYGSNMLAAWLQRRCPSARVQCVAYVEDWEMLFSKQSRYGSGKATIERSPGNRVFGVIFELQEEELPLLDQAEGPGYRREDNFRVRTEDGGETVGTITYIARPECTDSTLKPCEWYVDLIVAGARQRGLPDSYVSGVEATTSMVDPIPDKSEGREALEMLRRGSR